MPAISHALIRGFVALCLLGSAQCAQTAGPGPDTEELAKQRLEHLAKARASLQNEVEQSAAALAGLFRDEVVAWTNVRPSVEDKQWDGECMQLQDAFLQAYMSHGFLLFPFEQDRPASVAYVAGKLPSGLYLGESDGAYLAGKHARFLIVPRLEVKTAKHAVKADIYDLKKGSKALAFSIAIPTGSDFIDQDLLGWTLLPERNIKMLSFAVSHLGAQVDRGECWDLPAHVINSDGGQVANYHFGTEVAWDAAKPGDVLTFGTDGASGGHVMVLLRWCKDRSQALILHQNANGVRSVALATLGPVENSKAGQPFAVWRP